MRIKLNENKSSSESSHWDYNDLYRRFNREFDFLLQSDGPNVIGKNSCYVKMPQLEERLEMFSESPVSGIKFLIGRTGVGKSTLLRNYYKTKRTPVITGKILTVILSLENRIFKTSELDTQLCGSLMSACEEIASNHKIEIDDSLLHQYMKTHCTDVPLRYAPNYKESSEIVMERLREKDYRAYTIEYFKYHLQEAGLTRVIIVIDDMESERQDKQELIIQHMCSTFRCLSNINEYEDRRYGYTVGLLFSVRPITERLIRKNQFISTLGMERPIIIAKPVPLRALFKSRFNYAVSHIGKTHIGNIESWNSAYKSLLCLIDTISDQYGYGILELFNNNIRRSLHEFQLLVVNRKWIQKGVDASPSFKIEEGVFSTTPAAVYSAIGMREGGVYPVLGTSIVNVFLNERKEHYDLLCLFLIRYMIVLNRNSDYLEETIEQDRLKEAFSQLFCIQDFDHIFSNLISRMCEIKLIEVEIIDDLETPQVFHIALLPRARQIWKLLSQSSILLQMFRDDTYQIFSGRDRGLSTSLRGGVLFNELLCFFEQIASWEKSYIEIFKKNNIEEAMDIFGNDTITATVLSGIKHSIYAYFKDREPVPEDIRVKLDSCNKINKEVNEIYS